MSPESYVLLLIGCWLLLASTTLWGILRVTRRHYLEPVENLSDPEPQPVHQPQTRQRTRVRAPDPAFANLIARVLSLASFAIAPFRTRYRRTSG